MDRSDDRGGRRNALVPSLCWSPEADLWRVLDAQADLLAVEPEVELAELLSWATAHCVLDEDDRLLLVGIAEAACRVEVPRSGEGRGGLCSRAGSSVVAAQHGISGATVPRRARRSMRALAEAHLRQLLA